ncbi:Uncharacterized protein SCG7086_AZ_00100 [Chlamydiales bacterium SCGC AG-110-P3]|nr:Uncharacterized protein SCG7086_AZ_00100 [Chlamydiales bacterium SCGC AG-110-P3]
MVTVHEDESIVATWQKLLALLLKEQGYYQAIYDITEDEHGRLVRGRPLNEVMGLLKKKKILVTCIDEIDNMLAPLRNIWIEHKDDSAVCIEIQQTVSQLDETLKKTLVLDQRNQQLMKQQLSVLSAQVAKGTKGV